MQDFNQVNLIGRLTRDAELKDYNGISHLDFSLAVNSSRKSGDSYVDEVSYINSSLWGSRAMALHGYMKKGTQVLLEGELKQDRWEKDGQKFSALKVVTRNIQLLGGKRADNSEFVAKEPSAPSPSAQSINSVDSGAEDYEGLFDPEDIPF